MIDANADPTDIGGLDAAIKNCDTIAELEAAVAANPGYLNLGLTTLEEFVANRCADSDLLDRLPAAICSEIGATPTEPAADVLVKKVSVTSPVTRGSTAKVTIKTEAKAKCSIDVVYNSGSSTAAGLTRKTADSTGKISWSWKVGTRTATGRYPIYIDCSMGDREGSLTLMFRVTT